MAKEKQEKRSRAKGLFYTNRLSFSAKYALGKKGSAQDLAYIMIGLFVFVIVTLIFFKVSTELNTQFQANDDLPATSKTAHQQMTNLFPGIIDSSFLFLTVFLSIGAIVLAALVRVHPIFIPIFIIAWLVIIFLSAVFSNAYVEMAATSELSSVAAQLDSIYTIMSMLPFIIGIIGGILAVVMYKAYRGEQYGY
jgi:hypothetical protein